MLDGCGPTVPVKAEKDNKSKLLRGSSPEPCKDSGSTTIMFYYIKIALLPSTKAPAAYTMLLLLLTVAMQGQLQPFGLVTVSKGREVI